MLERALAQYFGLQVSKGLDDLCSVPHEQGKLWISTV